VQWIETLRRNELYDAESTVPDSDEEAVRLMTVHGSKGLEFPIVILSGLGGGGRPSDGVEVLPDRLTALAEGVRLLYVAATRAREHLVLCLFHSTKYGKGSHAAAIYQRLPELGAARPVDISLADLELQAAVGIQPRAECPIVRTPAEQEADEAAWLQRRASALATLGVRQHATPSGLAHTRLPADADSDAVESPHDASDTEVSPARSRPPRAATGLGLAVHAVLQWLDLKSLANLEALAAWSSQEYALDSTSSSEVGRLARNAVESAPVREAVSAARYWREVPLSVVMDGVLIDGTIERAASYRFQGRTYAEAVRRTTARRVERVHFVFAAAHADSAVVITETDVSACETMRRP